MSYCDRQLYLNRIICATKWLVFIYYNKILGVCYKVGCDWIVGSDMEEDACGVCGGNGSDCKTVQGIYNKDTTRISGLSEVSISYLLKYLPG